MREIEGPRNGAAKERGISRNSRAGSIEFQNKGKSNSKKNRITNKKRKSILWKLDSKASLITKALLIANSQSA